MLALLLALPPSLAAGAPSDLPPSIGVMGVGTIGSAVVRGLLSAPAGHLPHVPSFVLFDTNASKAAAFKAEFPGSDVSVATSDQEVIDEAACIILALPGGTAKGIIASLKFAKDKQVISLISAIHLSDLQHLVPAAVIATPTPSIAKQQGATMGLPPSPVAEAIFGSMGTYTAVTSTEQWVRMLSVGAFMGDFYKRQDTMQQWLGSHGVPADTAASYISSLFVSFAADSAGAGPDTFAEKVAEQTPGGLNQQVIREQADAGVYAGVNTSSEAIYQRNNKTSG